MFSPGFFGVGRQEKHWERIHERECERVRGNGKAYTFTVPKGWFTFPFPIQSLLIPSTSLTEHASR